MISKEQVQNLLIDAFATNQIFVQDLTGTQDHYKVTIISDLFLNKSRVQRQQLVNKALAEPLKGPLHALTMETYTLAEYKNLSSPTPKQIEF